MSRKIIAASVVFTSIACSDRAALTSPKVSDSRLASASVASCSPAEGQALIEAGQYKHAIREFGCVIAADPTSPEGYRGRAETALMLGKFSDAAADYARITAFVKPVHPDAHRTIIAGYEARLRANPDGVAALTGQSFAYWWDFDYAAALQALEHLLDVKPNDV